ncbi:MAG: L-histidine N(alpha)-methyltransferase [Alphaproteobacteria bacterium]
MTGSMALQLAPLEALYDYGHGGEDFGEAVRAGLSMAQKRIPSKFFYDAHGSALFEDICEVAEYYPTRTEIGLLRAHGSEIAVLAGQGASVVEFGSGASVKVRLLLDGLDAPDWYVPVDISREHLVASAKELAVRYPALTVLPICADYTRPFDLPRSVKAPILGFFPGSTIGNFTRDEAQMFLRQAAVSLGPGAGLLLGADLLKDPAILRAAYNDAAGVTADFNLNLLVRINRELGGDFNLSQFRHEAMWVEDRGCIEMHLISLRAQVVRVGGKTFAFREGESIHTEYSHKYTVEQIQGLVRSAGWKPVRHWVDDQSLFSIHYLQAP